MGDAAEIYLGQYQSHLEQKRQDFQGLATMIADRMMQGEKFYGPAIYRLPGQGPSQREYSLETAPSDWLNFRQCLNSHRDCVIGIYKGCLYEATLYLSGRGCPVYNEEWYSEAAENYARVHA